MRIAILVVMAVLIMLAAVIILNNDGVRATALESAPVDTDAIEATTGQPAAATPKAPSDSVAPEPKEVKTPPAK